MIPNYSDSDDRSIKAVTGALISAVGGPSAAAIVLRSSTGKPLDLPHLSRWASPSDMTRFMPWNHVVRLEIAAEQSIVSRWTTGRLARDGSACPGEMKTPDALRLMECTAVLNAVVAQAFADGRADSAERALITKETTKMRQLLDEIDRKNAAP